MKLFNRTLFVIALFGLTLLVISLANTNAAKSSILTVKEIAEASESSEASLSGMSELEKKKHKRSASTKVRKVKARLAPPLPVFYNTSIQNNTLRSLNYTYIKRDLNDFKSNNKRWNYKILDKQLEDIFRSLNQRQMDYNTIFSDRAYMEIFLNNFNFCDINKDQVLDIKEFMGCMSSDVYLAQIIPPTPVYANQQNYTDKTFFLTKIFTIMDTHNNDYLNFHAYMEFRLMVFSWRKCSVLGPFIEETSWECALDVISNMKTMSRPSLRNTYIMCLEISNSWNVRTIDFVSFLYFASGARLYGRINGKSDGEITSKFNFFNVINYFTRKRIQFNS